MERIETSKFTRALGGYLDRIAAGEQIMLTRYGKDVALVISPLEEPRPANAAVAAQSARDELLRKVRTR